ncbi:1-acyl-sn-glycerol-3-phosphate acyltransferase [Sphingobacterium wenxiniae]|uniref:1-acyl-sn-glycerol-3-phosphate acyltransferase n=1 Tax=Sphingobacterium wenxiniae TaxID=683125 RepID=A0A1I6NUF3_9SPHI|nr:1-acyl-sn-glycerol-3-phosphate acyltransferase [Sphingobacterium wenxiniae]SFS31488.1 1-acyl-sn-glycerol-3-phosphate acyltransferase [Sphingobacterium wenxiniae]
MLYQVLRAYVRLGLHWYVPDFRKDQLEQAKYEGPSVIVSNHPNSFFDSLIIAVNAPVEIRFLTRGDIFKHPLANWVLRSLYMLPIYKRTDDPEYAVKNDFTFDECMRQLQAGKHILIFPEGRSHNLWYLQPLMNGGLTSLMERAYWAEVPLQIQPYVLNYNSFVDVPKSVSLKALPVIDTTEYISGHAVQSAEVIQVVKENLKENMTESPLEPHLPDEKTLTLLRIPAKIGYYTQFWFYRLWRDYIRKRTEGTIFFDSLLFGVLLFSYPVFVFLISFIVGKLTGFWIGLFVFLFLPATAYCMAIYQKIKVETDLETHKGNRLSK